MEEEESKDVDSDADSDVDGDSEEEERSKVKKEDTKKEDFLKVVEGSKRRVVTTREWQEIKPRTVRAVKAFGEGREEMLTCQLVSPDHRGLAGKLVGGHLAGGQP